MTRRSVVVHGEIAHVPLTKGMVAIIDSRHAHAVESGGLWHATDTHGVYYARRSVVIAGKQNNIKLHRFIWAQEYGREPVGIIDHKNRNTLDCRADNLREASTTQSSANRGKPRNNTSGYKGVSFDATRNSPKKWKSYIRGGHERAGTRKLSLGWFLTAEEAAYAYDAAAIRIYGEFAQTNFEKR